MNIIFILIYYISVDCNTSSPQRALRISPTGFFLQGICFRMAFFLFLYIRISVVQHNSDSSLHSATILPLPATWASHFQVPFLTLDCCCLTHTEGWGGEGSCQAAAAAAAAEGKLSPNTNMALLFMIGLEKQTCTWFTAEVSERYSPAEHCLLWTLTPYHS